MDPNVVYPRDRLLELEEEGTIGRLADEAVSMVGSIRRYDELVLETVPQILVELRRLAVDLVLVLPFCPQCHVAAGLMARALEKRGLPTASIVTLLAVAEAVKPPRAVFLDFPLGCPAGRPGKDEQQRDILRTALRRTALTGDEWRIERLPHTWSPDGGREWEALVNDLYRIDNEIRGTLASREQAPRDRRRLLVGKEREFAVRCDC